MAEEIGGKRGRWRRVIVVVLGLLVVSALYGGGIELYSATQEKSQPFVQNRAAPPGHLEAFVRTTSVDPNQGDLDLRVEVRPDDTLAGPDGISVSRPVRIDVAGETGKASYRYAPGDHIAPIDVTIGLIGDPKSYPLDSYKAPFALRAVAYPSQASEQENDVASALPTTYAFDTTASGFRIGAKPIATPSGAEQAVDPNTLYLDLSITRARVTVAFAILILVLQVLLAAAAAALAVFIWRHPSRVEPPLLTWLAALLFAIVPLRNAMPGAPSIGALVDVLVFFWAVTVIALSMMCVLIVLMRKPAAQT